MGDGTYLSINKYLKHFYNGLLFLVSNRMVQQKFLSFLEAKGGFDSIVVHASTRNCGQSESLAGKADVLGYIAGVDGSENCVFLIAELVLVQVADNHEKQRSFATDA